MVESIQKYKSNPDRLLKIRKARETIDNNTDIVLVIGINKNMILNWMILTMNQHGKQTGIEYGDS